MSETAYFEIKIACECGFLWLTMMVPTKCDDGVNQAPCPKCHTRGSVMERKAIDSDVADAQLWQYAKGGASAFLSKPEFNESDRFLIKSYQDSFMIALGLKRWTD